MNMQKNVKNGLNGGVVRFGWAVSRKVTEVL